MATKIYYDIDGTPNVVNTRWTNIRENWHEIPFCIVLCMLALIGFVLYFIPTQIIWYFKNRRIEKILNTQIVYFDQQQNKEEIYKKLFPVDVFTWVMAGTMALLIMIFVLLIYLF